MWRPAAPPEINPGWHCQAGFFLSNFYEVRRGPDVSDTTTQTENINIAAQRVLASPAALKEALPASEAVRTSITSHRETINRVLRGIDHRLIVVVGPCSIHNIDEAMEYAHKLRELAGSVSDNLIVVMRAYFCLLYTSPSPRDLSTSRMPSSA